MMKMLKCKPVLFVSLFVLSAAASSIAAEGDLRWLVSPKLLEHARLKMLWQNKLPIKNTESLEQLFILGNRIYALSDRNYMVSLNREKGNVVFSKNLAPVGFPIVCLELYNDELLTVVGNNLVEINPEFGTERSATPMRFGIVCPAARNSSYYYLGGSDRRVHALRAGDKVQIFQVAADDDSVITSIVAGENLVVFGTSTGRVISFAPDRPKQIWPFYAAGGIVGPIARDAKSLFFASKDTNVYRIDMKTGELVWKHQTAAVLDKAPQVSEKVVYQYVRNKGLTAIDKNSGKFMWKVQKGLDLLTEADGKAYVITEAGTLVVMDNKKARQLYSVNFANVSRYAANVVDSKIYIADHAGRIACLKPIE